MIPMDEGGRPTMPFHQTMSLVHVPRWIIVPMRRQQTVAEHSFRVALIAGELAARSGCCAPRDSVLMVAQALHHDRDEAVTGDIPSPDKAANYDGLNELDLEELIVKTADTMEAKAYLTSHYAGRERPDYGDITYKAGPTRYSRIMAQLDRKIQDCISALNNRTAPEYTRWGPLVHSLYFEVEELT